MAERGTALSVASRVKVFLVAARAWIMRLAPEPLAAETMADCPSVWGWVMTEALRQSNQPHRKSALAGSGHWDTRRKGAPASTEWRPSNAWRPFQRDHATL